MARSAKKTTGGQGQQARPGRSGNPAVRATQPEPRPRPAGNSGSRTVRKTSAGRPSRSTADVPAPNLPPNGVGYPQILRTTDYAPWRSIVGVLMGLSFFVLLTGLVSQVVVFLSWALFASGTPYPTYYGSAMAFERPSGMLGANLGIAMLIPVSCLLMMFLHRMRPAWLLSVVASVRWPYFVVCLGIAAVALGGVQAVSMLVGGSAAFHPQQGFWGFLVVILLTAPIQAAAEEVFFRGYLMQALGSLFAKPWIGVVLSAAVFAFFHGAQNLPLFLDRFAFGLLAAALVWRTGGIEAGVAAHVVNNIFAYVLAGLTTSIAAVKAVHEVTWVAAVVDVGGFALFGAFALLVARKLKPATRVDLTGNLTAI